MERLELKLGGLVPYIFRHCVERQAELPELVGGAFKPVRVQGVVLSILDLLHSLQKQGQGFLEQCEEPSCCEQLYGEEGQAYYQQVEEIGAYRSEELVVVDARHQVEEGPVKLIPLGEVGRPVALPAYERGGPGETADFMRSALGACVACKLYGLSSGVQQKKAAGLPELGGQYCLNYGVEQDRARHEPLELTVGDDGGREDNDGLADKPTGDDVRDVGPACGRLDEIIPVGEVRLRGGYNPRVALHHWVALSVDEAEIVKACVSSGYSLKVLEDLLIIPGDHRRQICNGAYKVEIQREPSLKRHRLHLESVRDVALRSPGDPGQLEEPDDDQQQYNGRCKKLSIPS